MKYTRKDNLTHKFLFLIVLASGIALIYLGFYELHWAWNGLTLPFGLMLSISGYKNYRRARRTIQTLEFCEDKLLIGFLNGKKAEIPNSKLGYSLLVKKYFNPVRSIELIEIKPGGRSRGKGIGKIHLKKWKKDIEPIARHLVRNKFERKEWRFGWGLGEYLMLFSLLLGMADGGAGDYVEGLLGGFSEPIGDLGEAVAGDNPRSTDFENRYVDRQRE